MNSKILPPALVAIPRSPTQCLLPPKRLGFAASTVFRGSSLSCRVSVPAVSLGWAEVGGFARRKFVARAEAEESDGGEVVVEEEEGSENVKAGGGEEEAVEVVEAVKEPRKPRVKLGEIIGILNRRAIEESDKIRPIPDIRTGDILEIKLEVSGNRRRLSTYKGIVISRQNAGIHTTIKVRRIIAGIGVEIVFPLYSPMIKAIKVVSHRKVRRARLYYLKDKLPRFSTFK